MFCWCGADRLESFIEHYGKCPSCGTIVALDRRSPDALKNYYGHESYWRTHVVQTYGHPDIEQRSHSDFRDRIPFWWNAVRDLAPNARSILEIGCAHGGFLSFCRDNGYERVAGIEVDESTCDFARKRFNLPEIHSGLWPEVEVEGCFDVICGFDVLEHFIDPLDAMVAVHNRLNPGGICLWQTPRWDGQSTWEQFKPDEHLFLFSPASVTDLMESSGMKCEIASSVFTHDMMVIGRPA